MIKLYKAFFLIVALIFYTPVQLNAYFKDYPPYNFKNGSFEQINAQLLIDRNKCNYESQDGMIIANLKETPCISELYLKVGTSILINRSVEIQNEVTPIPHALYQADLDGNGLKDFILLSSYRFNTGYDDYVEVFLSKPEGAYEKISYATLKSGIEDFFDLNDDGKCEVIITGLYHTDKHNYFTYNIYELMDFRLVNVDAKFKGFPKFIWYTNKPNDRGTEHLTKEERRSHTKKKNDSIQYSEIK